MSGDKSPRFSPIQKRIKTSTLLPGFHKYPNFYACYLLSSYHNGGPVRTKYHRPWEMELICFGFPSKPVVLQSRHLQIKRPVNSGLIHVSQIEPVEKINSQPEIEKIAIFPKSLGNQLEVKLKILRKMMSIKPWSCYPLKIIFFEESAYQLWLKQANEKPKRSTSRTAESGECEAESFSIDVSFRPEGVDGKSNKPLNVNNGSGIVLKDFLTYVCCLLPTCFITLHLFCLSKYYLEQDSSHSFNADKEGISYKCQQIVPDSGSCPACYNKACWGELIQNCYRRMAANLQDKVSNSSKSEDEHTKDTVMDKEKEDSATLDERITWEKYRKDDVSLCQSESVSNNILSSLAPLAKPKFLATRKKIQKNKIYASGQKTCQSNSIERSREKNSPQHLRSKPSYKKVDPDEDEGEDKIVQMMDELEFDD
ncbi:hypothetical protein PPACK8108_LOCUS1602 [Phakopsora pachyrhizi]|uniref:Structure-specific endonuclease subunit SLX1 C-terminal domain-containing protein n=1 Tax=Phakopsora pachyrhizi TaxID=170000 RepID=A0AAV0AGA5_PHAPC|nr:hypothetical protein PPACK8108_LOCUS1602 [Phakopsora pachyrhizi]